MATTIKISPVTRIEGHLEVEITVDTVNGVMQVTDAKCISPMFRGFETILVGRDPRDATHFTQRVCGVCPVSHGMASTLALEAAFGVSPTDNGRILRNLVLGANYIQSHILHFYHLSAPDYINATGLLNMSPWQPQYVTPDMATGATAAKLVGNYVKALEMRRKAHQMGAIFGGKLPMAANFVPGGSSQQVTTTGISQFSALLGELKTFINNTYLNDVLALAGLMPNYFNIGRGCGNLLSFGVFDLNAAGSSKLFKRGLLTGGAAGAVDPALIKEQVASSWFAPTSGNLNPLNGKTEPSPAKAAAYSWTKSPRYNGLVYEVGPLARMRVSGNDKGTTISVLDRITARAFEASLLADNMTTWLGQLKAGVSVYNTSTTPAIASGIGMTEAARGALGHWLQISGSKISSYQIITPTAWNASPKDDTGKYGPIEQALIGTPVKDTTQPVEVLRVIHSFDPCLACSVHLLRPGQDRKTAKKIVVIP